MNKIDLLGKGDKDRYNQEAEIEQNFELLLLGAGEAGKSTIFKQLLLYSAKECNDNKVLDKGSFPLHDTPDSVMHVFSRNLTIFFLQLIKLHGTTGDVVVDRLMRNGNGKDIWRAEYVSAGGISNEGVDLISQIWNSKNAQEVWKHRNEFQLSESLEYFCQRENLNRMKYPYLEVVPDDYIHCAITTCGVSEANVKINGQSLHVVDTGGQRSERKKWIQLFDDVSVIMFVAALDEFDRVLFEDCSVNRWEETLTLFASVVNFKMLETTPFILILNRVDLLEKKLAAKEKEGVNLDNYFPELGLGTDYDEALPQVMEYIRQQLVAKLKPTQPFMVQYVNAVDKDAFPQWIANCCEWMESIC